MRLSKKVKGLVNVPGLEGLELPQAIFVIEYLKDFDPRRAAAVAQYKDPSYGYNLLQENDAVKRAVNLVLQRRLEESDIDAEWLLYEAMDNHLLARQMGNIGASNRALELIGKMALVDAFAAEKVELNASEAIVERLTRGRERARNRSKGTSTDEPGVSFV
jgi:hypothetical protein